jgi:DNA-binding transcriptional ArsR family regulator
MSDISQVESSGENIAAKSQSPRLTWDSGTAYDFFMSLEVLHHPDEYGLRASWAAGVRSRLPSAERKMLEEIQDFLWLPMHWIHNLPAPKDAATVIWAMRQIPAGERPVQLVNLHETDDAVCETFRKVVERRTWDKNDLDSIKSILDKHNKTHLAKNLPALLDWWSRPDELGELYLSALESYYKGFFAEEEKRIAPILRSELERAQELAQRLDLPDLLVELSQGVHFEQSLEVDELVLVPGYWNTPLIVFPMIGPKSMLFMFGARPGDMALVPGEPVPDTLLRVLKAIADPTRLRILNYLSQDKLTPAELARRLRLRAPTVTHHLSALRLAGLVHVTLESGSEKCYAARLEAIQSIFTTLENYLVTGSDEDQEVE